MRTLLIITKQPALANAVQTVLDPVRFQLIVKEAIAEAEFLLSRGAIDATILDAELTDARAIRLIEDLKTFAPGCPILIYAGEKQWEWEEDAYLLGVEHILTKPVRGKMLNTLLDRLFPEKNSSTEEIPSDVSAQPRSTPTRLSVDQIRTLEAMRRFSSILAHGLDATGLTKQLLQSLREIIGLNRAALFLRKPLTKDFVQDDRWMRAVAYVGVGGSVLQHFALSLNAGIGGYLHSRGEILRANSEDAQKNREIMKEFQLLAAQVAIPILHAGELLGAAVFGGRLTGEPYLSDELAVIFGILEEVGSGIYNSWLHDQVIADQRMDAAILGHLGARVVVIGSNLQTLHASPEAKKIFLDENSDRSRLEFSDLPAQLGALIFRAIKSGVGMPPFNFHFPQSPAHPHRISIIPFFAQGATESSAALLSIEDAANDTGTQDSGEKRARLPLVKSISEQLADEVGNALAPLSSDKQSLADSMKHPKFEESLREVLAEGVERIIQHINRPVVIQMFEQQSPDVIGRLADLLDSKAPGEAKRSVEHSFAQLGSGTTIESLTPKLLPAPKARMIEKGQYSVDAAEHSQSPQRLKRSRKKKQKHFDPAESGRRVVNILQKAEGGAWTEKELESRFQLTSEVLRGRRERHQILYWNDAKNQYCYPKWQFTESGKLLDGIQDVLQVFRSSDQWRLVGYFLTPSHQLNGRSPLDLLRAGDLNSLLVHASAHEEENTW